MICAASACGGSTSQKARTTSPPPASTTTNPRQRATICTAKDASGSPDSLPLPNNRRLRNRITTWFGHVQLDPPSNTRPTASLAEAWTGTGFFDERYPSAIFDVVLAEWTSDEFIVMKANGQSVPHRHVLAWVAMGKHRPVDAIDVSTSLTVPGVACYFGTSITAVNAMTGQLIADAWDYH
jgi:hypothetical protein